jgi:hypothetical protein
MAKSDLSDLLQSRWEERDFPQFTNLAKMVKYLKADLVEIKATNAVELKSPAARQVLFHGIESLSQLLDELPETLSTRAWVVRSQSAIQNEERDHFRVLQMALLRLSQIALALIIIILSIIDTSLFSIIASLLLVLIVGAEISFLLLDPFRKARQEWLTMVLKRRLPRAVRWLVSAGAKQSDEPEFSAEAEILCDHSHLLAAVKASLETLEIAVIALEKAPDSAGELKLHDHIVHPLQSLWGVLLRGDTANLKHKLELELSNLCAFLDLEVIAWDAEPKPELWEKRLNTTVAHPKMVVPALRHADQIFRGIVYLPKEARTHD